MVFIRKASDLLIIASEDKCLCVGTGSEEEEFLKLPELKLQDNLTKNQKQFLLSEPKSVISIEISTDEKYIVVCLQNKQVVVYDKSLTVVNNFIAARVSSKACFTPNNDLIVADKTGDVYLYSLQEEKEPVLLLGHLSVILDVTFSECGKYIITCDRDEKIRVSRFPNAYNIVSFCLGHTEFVTSVKMYGDNLVSGSGDGTVRFWNFKTGKQLALINTSDQIQDTHLLETFSEEMDKENIDVSALPIIDMQVCGNRDILLIAVSIYNYNSLLLYSFNCKSYTPLYFKSVQTSYPYNFHLDNMLYLMTSNLLSCYEITSEEYKCVDTHASNIIKKYAFKLTTNSDILVLYKKKFDNVQEYLEKKKIRLSAK